MKIIHRVSVSATEQDQDELASVGIALDGLGFVTFEIDEEDRAWPEVSQWIARRRAADSVSTRFTKEEIAEADWLELVPLWHHGYPQPDESEFGFRNATFDMTKCCQCCGIGMRQKAEFQMKSEPKWGKRSILQMNWIFDEFFVKREVWAAVFQPLGIACRRVIGSKGSELVTVVQLDICDEVGVETDGLVGVRCGECERVKYLPELRGRFPAMLDEPREKIVRTREYFGSGASAHKRVLVHQDVVRAISEAKVEGVGFRPVRPRIGVT